MPMVMALQQPTRTGGKGERRTLRDAVREGMGHGRGNPSPTAICALYTARWPTNRGVRLWGHHHTSRVGEGPGTVGGRQEPKAGRCGRAVAPARRSSVCPLGQGRAGLMGGPHYSPRWRGPLTSSPRPQSWGLNFPNRSVSFKFEIQTRSNID
jgi:hypothetical protein